MTNAPGIEFAPCDGVRTRRFGQTILIFVPLFICGARLHAGTVGTPAGVTQEVARCLNLVRVAAARRNGSQSSSSHADRPQHGGSGTPPG